MAVDVMGQQRIDRLLSNLGFGSRNEIRKAADAGRIILNGSPVRKTDVKADPEKDELCFDGRPVRWSEYEYWVLYKPRGILSATEDRRHETVIDYMGLKRKGMAPCGRLDLDTEGLLLVTDDGALVHRLLSPKKLVDKVYEAEYEGVLPADAAERAAAGIVLEDGTKCMPADLDASTFPARITVREGKYHEVRRIFAALGCTVTRLTRLSMGPLSLSSLGLEKGEYRRLTDDEAAALKAF